MLTDGLWRVGWQSETANKDAWKHGCTLHVDARVFKVLTNIPAVNVQLRQPAIEGFAIQPTFSVEFGRKDQTQWRWYATDAAAAEDASGDAEAAEEEMELVGEAVSWYVPGPEDVGRRIVAEVTPFRKEQGGQTTWGRSVSLLASSCFSLICDASCRLRTARRAAARESTTVRERGRAVCLQAQSEKAQLGVLSLW